MVLSPVKYCGECWYCVFFKSLLRAPCNALFSSCKWVKQPEVGHSCLRMTADRPFLCLIAWNCHVSQAAPSPATGHIDLMAAQLFQTLHDHSEYSSFNSHCNWNHDSCSKRPCPGHNHSQQSAVALEGSISGKTCFCEIWMHLKWFSLRTKMGGGALPQPVAGGSRSCAAFGVNAILHLLTTPHATSSFLAI
jgi:hypothetical protein